MVSIQQSDLSVEALRNRVATLMESLAANQKLLRTMARDLQERNKRIHELENKLGKDTREDVAAEGVREANGDADSLWLEGYMSSRAAQLRVRRITEASVQEMRELMKGSLGSETFLDWAQKSFRELRA